MERYRSYSEGQSDYPDGVSAPPDYQENNQAWYGEWSHREPDRREEMPRREEPPRYEEPQRYDEPPRYEETQRYEEPRHDPARDHGRVSPGPAPASPNEPIRVSAAVPRPMPSPSEEPRMPPPRRPMAAPGSPGPMSENVYRSKRPGAAALFGVPAAILEIPALLLLQDAAFADPVSAGGVVAAACLMLALPLLAVGLYAVATGAVRAAGPNSAQAWLRPPVAYLSVGLVLFIAAGLAAT